MRKNNGLVLVWMLVSLSACGNPGTTLPTISPLDPAFQAPPIPAIETTSRPNVERNQMPPKDVLRAIAARSRAARANGDHEQGLKRLYAPDGRVVAEWGMVSGSLGLRANSLRGDLLARPLSSFLSGANEASAASISPLTVKTFHNTVPGGESWDTLRTDGSAAYSTYVSETGATYGTSIADFVYSSTANVEKMEHITYHESWDWIEGPSGWLGFEVVLSSAELAAAKLQFAADTAALLGGALRAPSSSFPLTSIPALQSEPDCFQTGVGHRMSGNSPEAPAATANCDVLEGEFRGLRAKGHFLGAAAVATGVWCMPCAIVVAAAYVDAKADYVAKGWELLACYQAIIDAS